jgi:hypothetical protein
MKTDKEVRVIGFITAKVARPIGPIPDNYLSNEVNIPKEFILEMIKNGWEDEAGVYYWSRDFKPAPVKSKYGNVYVCISDADIKNSSRFINRMKDATKLLYAENT